MEGYVSKEEQLRKKKNKENRDKIIEINQKAKELGMSYGKYVAMERMKREKWL